MKNAYVVAGLAFGDEGKGKMVDFLCRQHNAGLVVRYNGGPQAGHNVVTDSGLHHTFSQFGSGTLAGAATHLSRFTLVDPFTIQKEAEELKQKMGTDPFIKYSVDPMCVVITPWHREMNRLRETLRTKRHGSVGLGIGEARSDELDGLALRAHDLRSSIATAGLLCTFKHLKMTEAAALLSINPTNEEAVAILHRMATMDPKAVANYFKVVFDNITLIDELPCKYIDSVVFEGAQGVLLDETHGFAPHNTWTDCTFKNADTLIKESQLAFEVEHIGVLRTYLTRHGAGPFPTEDKSLSYPELHNNGKNSYVGEMRLGRFDPSLVYYGIDHAGPINCIAITHMDVQSGIDWATVSNIAQVPIKYHSFGPSASCTRINPVYDNTRQYQAMA